MRSQLQGKRYGRLVALEYVGRTRSKASLWRCLCDCGGEATVTVANLNRSTRSCGCLQREAAAKSLRTHGLSGHPLYKTWSNIRNRCNNPKLPRYPDYGGRGIKVCARWDSFENFLADMGERPKGMTVERVDNDGDYEPSNCTWATKKAQIMNSRRVVLVTHRGITDSVRGWAQRVGRLPNTVKAGLGRHGVEYLDRFEVQS